MLLAGQLAVADPRKNVLALGGRGVKKKKKGDGKR